MTVNFTLNKNYKNSFGEHKIIVVIFSQENGKRKIKQHGIGYSKIEHFDVEAGNVNQKHPDFNILAPKILNYKLKARKLLLNNNYNDLDHFLADLLNKELDAITMIEAFDEVIEDIEKIIKINMANGNKKEANSMKGNLKVYKNVKNQFSSFANNATLISLDYNLLHRFKSYQLSIGNSKATVHNYLRTIRAVYKKSALKYKLPYSNPFDGVFQGLTTKSYASKKKNISALSLKILETAELLPHERKYTNIWLLQFYFGGADLIDIYYLKKNNIRRGRIYFERIKTNNGLPIDLKIHPKAEAILSYYIKQQNAENWLFPFPKSKESYENFRSKYAKFLKRIQEKLEIEVLPTGGFVGIKVARHTFANIGKQLFIQEDILRELMGHERNEVDNYYKDKYPEELRDEALFKIIDSIDLEKLP